jgi:manganese oxidase
VAAVEVNWDYAPSGRDEAMGMPLDAIEEPYVEPAARRIGRMYKKAVYREFTDETFTTEKVRPPEKQYLSILGPILRGEVGDTIRLVFRNKASHLFSIHPHGVFYEKDSKGADYNDGTSPADKKDVGVPPGGTHDYN